MHLHGRHRGAQSSFSSLSGIPHFLWVSISLFLSFVSVLSVISLPCQRFPRLVVPQGSNQAGRVCPSTIVDWARWCVCSRAHHLAPACCPSSRRLPTILRHTIPHRHRYRDHTDNLFLLRQHLPLPTPQRLEARSTDRPARMPRQGHKDGTGRYSMGYNTREGKGWMGGWEERTRARDTDGWTDRWMGR